MYCFACANRNRCLCCRDDSNILAGGDKISIADTPYTANTSIETNGVTWFSCGAQNIREFVADFMALGIVKTTHCIAALALMRLAIFRWRVRCQPFYRPAEANSIALTRFL
ncbi:hypothetical protein QTP88_014656 [Uroleucon formosanum]